MRHWRIPCGVGGTGAAGLGLRLSSVASPAGDAYFAASPRLGERLSPVWLGMGSLLAPGEFVHCPRSVMSSKAAALLVLTPKIQREGPSWSRELVLWLENRNILGARGCPKAGELGVLGLPMGAWPHPRSSRLSEGSWKSIWKMKEVQVSRGTERCRCSDGGEGAGRKKGLLEQRVTFG